MILENGRVVPSRITEAREARSMSMGELGDHIGITRQSISKYEQGIIIPSFEVLNNMAKCLEMPIDFFYKNDYNVRANASAMFFRSNVNVSKKVKNACKYQVKWANEIINYLAQYIEFIRCEVPTIDTDYEILSLEDIEDLALQIREKWNLGDQPINDVIGILESRGIIIGQFTENAHCSFRGVTAFSAWANGVPYILYNSEQKSAVRITFSILHELGHLILHNSISEQDAIKRDVIDLADKQADRFAAAFLLPATSFPKDIRGTSIDFLVMLKHKWRAAISTMLKRCEDLELLSEYQIAYLKRQMTIRKYWRKEPLDDELTVEPSELIKDAIYLLIENRIITENEFCNSLALSQNDLRCLCGLPEEFFNKGRRTTKLDLKIIPLPK